MAAWELSSSASSSSSDVSDHEGMVAGPKRKVGRPRNCPIDFGKRDVSSAVRLETAAPTVPPPHHDRLSMMIRPLGGVGPSSVANLVALGRQAELCPCDVDIVDRVYPPEGEARSVISRLLSVTAMADSLRMDRRTTGRKVALLAAAA